MSNLWGKKAWMAESDVRFTLFLDIEEIIHQSRICSFRADIQPRTPLSSFSNVYGSAFFEKTMFGRTNEFCMAIIWLHRQQSQWSDCWAKDKPQCWDFSRSSLICPHFPGTKLLFAVVSVSLTCRYSEQWDHSRLNRPNRVTSLPPWGCVRLEKQTVAQPLKKSSTLHGTWRFITVVKRSRH